VRLSKAGRGAGGDCGRLMFGKVSNEHDRHTGKTWIGLHPANNIDPFAIVLVQVPIHQRQIIRAARKLSLRVRLPSLSVPGTPTPGPHIVGLAQDGDRKLVQARRGYGVEGGRIEQKGLQTLLV